MRKFSVLIKISKIQKQDKNRNVLNLQKLWRIIWKMLKYIPPGLKKCSNVISNHNMYKYGLCDIKGKSGLPGVTPSANIGF